MKKLKREFPLVLLHVTLLPIPVSYSPAIMQKVLPHHILENWKLLQEKVTDTVLERGILIPHPLDEYELLEERLLESLELKVPKILQCGHFHRDEDEVPYHNQSDHDDADSDDDADICDDCGRRVRDGRFGTGTRTKRWNIKVFAANGLMRTGAWAAAWREMERIDVEIIPWIDEDMKRHLELQKQEEARRIPRQVQEENQDRSPRATSTMDEARMREIYGDEPHPYIDESEDEVHKLNETRVSPSPDLQHEHQFRPESPSDRRQARPESPLNSQYQRQAYAEAIPLEVLLRNYIYLAAQDRRNIAIFFLSLLVLFLALSKPAAVPLQITPPSPDYFSTTASIPHFEVIIQSSAPISSSAFASHPLTVSVSSFEVRSHTPSAAPIASIPQHPPDPQTVVASVAEAPSPEKNTFLVSGTETRSPDAQRSEPSESNEETDRKRYSN